MREVLETIGKAMRSHAPFSTFSTLAPTAMPAETGYSPREPLLTPRDETAERRR